ncbi:hypothetical protein V6N12_056152 [Hibiscus sabdariffa]|uniref:Uncharacterized protein n=1 Tax=Hibiscus sabdariffa TaxID=183260 RepID=A0ABR2CRQ3_9ROSI
MAAAAPTHSASKGQVLEDLKENDGMNCELSALPEFAFAVSETSKLKRRRSPSMVSQLQSKPRAAESNCLAF